MPHVFYSSTRYISNVFLVLVALLQAAAAHCELLFCNTADLSCLWLIDVRFLMRVSTPGVCLLYTVNPSRLLHFRLLPPALCF